jgi:hypothetical protein
LRALLSSVLLSSSAGGGDLTPGNGSLDIRHRRGPPGAGTWAVSTAICLCRRCHRRPNVLTRLRADERSRSWPYNAVDWPITSNCHADWHAGTNMKMGKCWYAGAQLARNRKSHGNILFSLYSFGMGRLSNWLPNFSDIFYYKEQRHIWV